jgi:hypothetical protein
MAGAAAEHVLTGRIADGLVADQQAVWSLCDARGLSQDAIDRLWCVACVLVKAHETSIRCLAVELQRHRELSGAQAIARRSPLALEAGGEAFRGLAGRSLAHRAGYAERSAEQLLLRAQRGQPLFVRARNIGAQ